MLGPAKNPLARRAHRRLDWLDVTPLVCIGGEGDRRHGNGWSIRSVHAVWRSRRFHEPSGMEKRNRASSGNVRAMTQDYLRYMEPGSDAVMRKHGEGGCCHWRSRTRRTRRGRAHAPVARSLFTGAPRGRWEVARSSHDALLRRA